MIYKMRRGKIYTESLAASMRHKRRVDACNGIICPRRREFCEHPKDLWWTFARYELETLGSGDSPAAQFSVVCDDPFDHGHAEGNAGNDAHGRRTWKTWK